MPKKVFVQQFNITNGVLLRSIALPSTDGPLNKACLLDLASTIERMLLLKLKFIEIYFPDFWNLDDITLSSDGNYLLVSCSSQTLLGVVARIDLATYNFSKNENKIK